MPLLIVGTKSDLEQDVVVHLEELLDKAADWGTGVGPSAFERFFCNDEKAPEMKHSTVAVMCMASAITFDSAAQAFEKALKLSISPKKDWEKICDQPDSTKCQIM